MSRTVSISSTRYYTRNRLLNSFFCLDSHKTENHDNVCRSTKWMMLHTRDCPGTTSTGDVCPFPWCRKVKHLLYHLVSCEHPEKCLICSPIGLSSNIKRLKAISDYRFRRRKIRHAQDPVDSVNVNSSGAAPVSCVEVVQTQVYPQSNCSNYTSGNENSITPVVEMTKGIAFNETRIGTSSQVPEILSSSVCTSTDSRERIHVGDVHGPSLKIEQDDVNTARHSDVAPSNILGSNVAEDREVCQMSSSPTTYAIGQDTGVGSHPTMVTEGERNLGGPLQPCNIAIVTSVGPNEIVKFSPDISYGLPVSNVGNDSSLRDVVNLHVSNVDEVQSHLPDNFCAIPLIAAGSNKSTCTPSHVAAVITNQDPTAFSKPTLLAMNSSQVVSASDTGSENAIAPNVFGTLNNTTYPSSDSLQSALAPFLTDHVDAADFQSEGLNCRIETSASLAAIASEFEESMLPWTRPVCAKTEVASEVNQERTTDVVDTLVKLEDSDSDVPYNQKLESKCISDERTMSFNPILIPVCKMEESFITQQIGEVSMIPPQQIEGSSVESNNSNAALTHATSTNTLSSSCKVEPSKIRKDRVSSESLVLRVQ
jgi:TAZ zinc finger